MTIFTRRSYIDFYARKYRYIDFVTNELIISFIK